MPSCKVISSEEISWTLNECKKYDNGKNINISRYRIKVVLWQHSVGCNMVFTFSRGALTKKSCCETLVYYF